MERALVEYLDRVSLAGGMVPSGLTYHPKKFLSGERIERHTAVTEVRYGYPIETNVLTKRVAGNWKQKEENLRILANTGTSDCHAQCSQQY